LTTKMRDNWSSIPAARQQEIEKGHPSQDLTTQIRDLISMGNSLGDVQKTFKIAENLPSYAKSPAAGEVLVVASP
jgi:hypothetical protein